MTDDPNLLPAAVVVPPVAQVQPQEMSKDELIAKLKALGVNVQEEVAPISIQPEPVKAVTSLADAPKELYGSEDKDKDFNLRELFPSLTELPTDLVLFATQGYHKNANGTVTEDKSARVGKVMNVPEFTARSLPDSLSGIPMLKTVLGDYKVLHLPKGAKAEILKAQEKAAAKQATALPTPPAGIV